MLLLGDSEYLKLLNYDYLKFLENLMEIFELKLFETKPGAVILNLIYIDI